MPKRTNPRLLVPLQRDGGAPLARQVEARLRELVPGTPLPPTRRLAADLGVARGTVVRAYAQLRHEGLLEGRVGAGSRIAPAPRPSGAPAAPPDRRWDLDLHPEVTDLAAFPRRAWLRAYGAAVHDLPDRALGYEEPLGLRELREELCVYLARARGVRCDPEQIVICGGLLAGLAIVRRALADTGVRCLHRARVSHRALGELSRGTVSGPATGWLDVDGAGLVVDALPRRSRQAVLVEPAGSYPLGARLSAARLTTLTEWARRQDAVLVESDLNAELDHDGVGLPALQGSLPERTVLIGSTSRALAPGLRVGWIVAPPGLVGALTAARRATEPGQPVLEQLALARFLAAGDLDRHLRRLRSTYRTRARTFANLLEDAVEGGRLDVPACGFHLVMGLPPGAADESSVVAAAAAAGHRVRLVGLAGHVLHGPPLPPALVLGYGALPEAAMARAVQALTGAMAARGRRPDDEPAGSAATPPRG
ncbi:PLP-dependent aminotransferase family protein [Paraconexibacter antarcticus]|uniref:aminotransferase-like domain-containing protein n=1 Tax=Paraconexibacter antarcticus TaxID=2949664 RepID=UPI00345F8AD7